MGNLDRSWQWVTTPWQNWLLELEEELIASLCGIFACLAAGRLTMKRLLGDEHPSGISKHPINWAHPTWWCSPRSYYKQMGKKAHQHSMTFLASLRKSLVKYMAMKIYSLISEAEFNPQDLIIPDKAQDMYLETKRKKKKKTKGSIYPSLSHCSFWAGSPCEAQRIMKCFGSAGRSVHQIVLQRAMQEIIHQVGEVSTAVLSRWFMIRTTKDPHWKMKQKQMKSNEMRWDRVRDWEA